MLGCGTLLSKMGGQLQSARAKGVWIQPWNDVYTVSSPLTAQGPTRAPVSGPGGGKSYRPPHSPTGLVIKHVQFQTHLIKTTFALTARTLSETPLLGTKKHNVLHTHRGSFMIRVSKMHILKWSKSAKSLWQRNGWNLDTSQATELDTDTGRLTLTQKSGYFVWWQLAVYLSMPVLEEWLLALLTSIILSQFTN